MSSSSFVALVSTHASVRRRQLLPKKSLPIILSFNSRLREEATIGILQGQRSCSVSTHASVRRRRKDAEGADVMTGFNSRLREEATIYPMNPLSQGSSFQLTPP